MPSPIRFGFARVAMLAAAAAALATPVLSLDCQSPDRRPSIAVLDFHNSALIRHADYEPLRFGIVEVLSNVLADNPQVRIVDRQQIDKALDELKLDATDKVDKETAVRIGRVLGAHHMIVGTFVIDMKGRVQIAAHAFDVETSAWEFKDMIAGKEDDLLDLIRQLGERFNSGMKLPDMPSRSGSSGDGSPGLVSGKQLDPVLGLGRALAARKSGDVQAAIVACKSALAQYPAFPAARELLASLERQPRGQ